MIAPDTRQNFLHMGSLQYELLKKLDSKLETKLGKEILSAIESENGRYKFTFWLKDSNNYHYVMLGGSYCEFIVSRDFHIDYVVNDILERMKP